MGGKRIKQYTDEDIRLIKEGVLTDELISQRTGTSIKVISNRRWRLKNPNYNKTVKTTTKKSEKPATIVTETPSLESTKQLTFIVNGIQLVFSQPCKKIIFGKNTVEIVI